MSDTTGTEARDCRTCGLLRPTRHSPLDECYMACGWQPETWPANCLHLEGTQLIAFEHDRLIPRKMLTDPTVEHLLRPCSAWRPKA